MLMSKITTLGIGGPVKEFFIAKTQDQLIRSIKQATKSNKSYLVIGSGSNLLVSDKGVNVLVIKNEIVGITTRSRTMVKIPSGTILQDLVDFTISHGLSGLHNLTGVPGTVGGAIFGNAGAYGQTISDYVTHVICFDGEKTVKLSKSQCKFSYRDSVFKKSKLTILEIHFKLQKSDPKLLRQEADEILAARLKKYHKGIKCPGSFFKNIIADELPQSILNKIPQDKVAFGKISAGYLLEAVGANGQSLNGIEITPYHGNLFVNKGRGKASDFYKLAKKYALKVKEKFGIKLEPEVQLINLPPIM